MNTIYKYPLDVLQVQTLRVPLTWEPLSVHVQNGAICIWALVDTRSQLDREVRVSVFGTGNAIQDDPGQFLGTVLLDAGSLVFHVFVADA